MALFLTGCLFLLFVSLVAAVPFNNRIIGGEFAAPGQFPFIVSIDVVIPGFFDGHYCGASILNNQWVVTAAHCLTDPLSAQNFGLFDPSQVTVLAATNLLDTNGTRYTADELFIHPNYSTFIYSYDIALVKIKEQFEFNDLVQTIEIGDVSGNDCSVIVGWGVIDVKNQTKPNELRYLEVTALSAEDCDVLAEGSPMVVPRGSGQVCVYRGVGQGACQGDSGGPMVFNGKLVGVTSYGIGGECADGYPDVYSRTAFYKDWIQEIISKN